MTEMMGLPPNLPPPLHPFARAMCHGLWGWVTRSLHLAVKLGIADALGDEPRSAAALAAATGCDPDALERMLRLLVGCDVFARRADGAYEHTAMSRCLRRDAPLSAAASALLQATPVYQAALANLEHTLRTGRPSVETVAPQGFFAYLRAHPDESRIFDAAMTALTPVDAGAVAAYDFSGSGVIADIGGGQGSFLRVILEHTPGVRTLLFDLPDVVASAPPAARLEVRPGNFFRDRLPSADLYLLKLILHDWPDDAALRILANIRQAARPGAKLLVIESLLQEGPDFHPSHIMDLSMLALASGRERSERQLGELFQASSFRHTRTIPTTSPIATIVEAVAV